MLKFYERREQVVKPGLARLSAIGSAKLTPFLTNDTSLCITAARVARVYTARGACSDRFESFITLQRFTLPRIFTRPCVALKTSRTIFSSLGSRLCFLAFFANPPTIRPPSWRENLVCTQTARSPPSSIYTFYAFFTLLYVFPCIFANEIREQIDLTHRCILYG